MSTFATTAHTTWVAGYDMTTDLNQLEMPIEWEPLDSTTYGLTRSGRTKVAGLESVSTTLNGFWDSGSGLIDPTVFDALTTEQVITHSFDGAEGNPAYFYQARTLQYQLFGNVGELVPFTLMAESARGAGAASVGAVRGPILKAKGNVSATGATGTANQMGAVSSGQYLYAVLHVFSAGTTITAVLESDDNSNFTSATTRAAFGPITTAGGTWATRVAGPITDDWYRLRITAITGTFSIACVAGIK